MAVTLSALINTTLSLLHEDSTSPVGQYDDGSGTVIDTSSQTIIYYLNDGIALLARTCLPFINTCTATAITSGVASVQFSALTDAAGDYMWQPVEVAFNGVVLTETSYSQMMINYPTRLTDTASTPVSWWVDDNESIALVPAPATTANTIISRGYTVPAPITATTALITWCAADETLYLANYAADRLSVRNMPEDSILSGKVMSMRHMKLEAMGRMSNRFRQRDRSAYDAYFAGSISVEMAAIQASMQQGQ